MFNKIIGKCKGLINLLSQCFLSPECNLSKIQTSINTFIHLGFDMLKYHHSTLPMKEIHDNFVMSEQQLRLETKGHLSKFNEASYSK